MPQPDNTNWIAWILSILGGSGALALVTRFFSYVTREELRQAIQDARTLTDSRHEENKDEFHGIRSELTEIRQAIGRIEGQISGRYPRIDR